MKTELDNKTYSLCEAVADLAGSFMLMDTIPADSREMGGLVIAWAREFEERNAGVNWGEDLGPDGNTRDYIVEIDAFFDEKYSAWRSSATDTRESDVCESKRARAAAQELLVSLREMVEQWDARFINEDASVPMSPRVERARAAIAKAEGRT